MTAANMPISTRYHGLDFMRAGMMLMGILLHAGVMYMPLPYGHDSAAIIADPLDPYRDISGYSGVVQRIVMTIHFFRMPAFMLLAGFFGALVFQKRGPATFLKNRFLRIVIPMVVFWFLIWPADRFAWEFGSEMILDDTAERNVAQNLGQSVSKELVPFIGEIKPHTMHLWFIYQLIFFYALTFILHVILRKVPFFLSGATNLITRIGSSKVGWVFLPLATACTWLILSANSTFHFAVSFSWKPEWYIPLAYYQFFLFGWIGYHHLGAINFARKNLHLLLPAIFVIVPLHLFCAESAWALSVEQPESGPFVQDYQTMKNMAVALQSCSVWIITLGLVGLSERLITKANPVLTFLVGASYWLYLVHRPLCVGFAALLQRWDIPGVIKYSVVCLIVTLICLLSYQLFVRRTFIGLLLNGKKY